MADEGKYSWPAKDEAQVIGTEVNRQDGLAKATGAAKYTYDVNLMNQLIAKGYGCPYGHCKLTKIDISAAKKTPGVVHVEVLRNPGDEIQWEGELLAVVAAESEAAAVEGRSKIKVDFETARRLFTLVCVLHWKG